mmetsp:Transcript_16801/g.30863  ORF Transcript_16801/g.30863 Transcript_16801/m.30863 type:complete len:94 (+) Transcript_16801:50-331(+)
METNHVPELDTVFQELEVVYAKYLKTTLQQRRNARIESDYHKGNAAYRAAFVEPFSLAYRQGSPAYVGDQLPLQVFAIFFLLGEFMRHTKHTF